MIFVPRLRNSIPLAATAAFVLTAFNPSSARAEAQLLVDVSTGRVLHAENATYPWYPASITKLMTAYVVLHAVKQRRIALDTRLTVSARAAAQAPSKMGFKPGTIVTVDNALKMLMVKSANDIAVVLAEGVSDSVEKFSDEMNTASRRLGMTQSNWVNPNGLPADEQISSARDLAILARAVIQEFPEYSFYWNIPGIKLGKKVMRNHNSLIGRYTGADGMKTGFICASGFNLVASATRNGKRLIAVVLGSPSSPVRGAKTAMLFERGFNNNGLAWLTPSLGTVNSLRAMDAAPPDRRNEMCGPHRKRPAAEELDDEPASAATTATNGDPNSPMSFVLSGATPTPGGIKPSQLLAPAGPVAAVAVYIGAAKKSAETQIAAQTKRGKPAAVAAPQQVAPAAVTAAAVVPAHQLAAGPGPATSMRFVTLDTPAPAINTAAMPQAKPLAHPSDAVFGPPLGQFTPPGQRKTPTTMSFAQPPSNQQPPLTAIPAAKPTQQLAEVPMPRPRPKRPTAAPR